MEKSFQIISFSLITVGFSYNNKRKYITMDVEYSNTIREQHFAYVYNNNKIGNKKPQVFNENGVVQLNIIF